jgi:hypothetical protein
MTPGDHGAIKLLLDAKVPAAVNGMLLGKEPGLSEPRGREGDSFTHFKEERADCIKHITIKDQGT